MLSAKDIALVKVAVEICNNPELKKEIFCAPGSDYDVNKSGWEFSPIEQWNKILVKKAEKMVRYLGLPENLQKKIIVLILLVGMRMLTWAKYHETYSLPYKYSINFLNSSFFTQQGIIDNKKAAEELVKDKSLSIKQKYKLACLYCFTDHISDLYRQMTREDKKEFYNAHEFYKIEQPGLVKFWSYYLMGEIDALKGEMNLNQYRLAKAVMSGSKTAVEYCLEKTNLVMKKDSVIDVALETLRIRSERGYDDSNQYFFKNEWFAFEDVNYDNKKWFIPRDYYIDILCCLLLRMTEAQQIEFLKKDIGDVNYNQRHFNEDHRYSSVLEYFLNWPYQNFFMKMANLMWEFLPENNYASLLLLICDKIEPKNNNLKYGEENSYDYRDLLRKFWSQSPDRFVRCVLQNCPIIYKNGNCKRLKRTNELLVNLFALTNFTNDDRKIIELIIDKATNEEKKNIIYSEGGERICIGLLRKEKWDILNEFVLNCFNSKELAEQFQRQFFTTDEAQHICIDFIKNEKWDAVEYFTEWSTLPEEEMHNLKEKMINSVDGRDACVSLISFDKIKVVDKFFKWCFPFEELEAFKKELVYSHQGSSMCIDLLMKDQLELVNKFMNFSLSSEEEVEEFKHSVAYTEGGLLCQKLISHYSIEEFYEREYHMISHKIKFNGGKWEEVEKFLTWCFSTEKEISDFKKYLLSLFGTTIHFDLIISNQWEEAETFFAWLELSAEEVKDLKKQTFFTDTAIQMFYELMYCKYILMIESDGKYAEFGSKQEAIELLLKWYLIDKEDVLEFKDFFQRGFKRYCLVITKEDIVIMKNFDLVIKQRLSDLDEINVS